MQVANHTALESADLTDALRQLIGQRTCGRVRELRVEVDADRIVVSGVTSTHYVKQLATQATLEVRSLNPRMQVTVQIQVGTCPPHQ